MKVAFHFNANHPCFDGSPYHLPIQEMCFRALLSGDTDQLHLKIYSGDLLVSDYIHNEEGRRRLIPGLLTPPYPVWQDIRSDFPVLMQTYRIYVLVFEGMDRKVRDNLNSDLKGREAYFGAQQVNEGNPIHFLLYRAMLFSSYRIFGSELRVFYHSYEEEIGNTHHKDIADHWRDLFPSVTFEDLGIKRTIFDRNESYEHAQRVANLNEKLGEHLAMLADEVLIRLEDSNPSLCDMMYSAFQRFEHFETIEDLSQAAVTCRRILKLFADAVYPPKKELVDGREVGKEQYRNRLWAYIKENISGKQGDLLLVELEDIGKRVDKLDELANKGTHANISKNEVQRLILGEIILLHDLSILTPPKQGPLDPVDTEYAKDVLRNLLEPTPTENQN